MLLVCVVLSEMLPVCIGVSGMQYVLSISIFFFIGYQECCICWGVKNGICLSGILFACGYHECYFSLLDSQECCLC